MERNLWHLRRALLVVLKKISCLFLAALFSWALRSKASFSWFLSYKGLCSDGLTIFPSCISQAVPSFLVPKIGSPGISVLSLKELDLPCAFFYSAQDGTQGLAHACRWDAPPAFAKLLLALTPLQSGNPHFCIPDLPSMPRFLVLKQTLAINWHLLLFLVPISTSCLVFFRKSLLFQSTLMF